MSGRIFGLIPSFGGPQPTGVSSSQPSRQQHVHVSSQPSGSGTSFTSVDGSQRRTIAGKGVLGIGSGGGKTGFGSKGLGKGISFKRHRKIPRDTIRGITNGDIRRLARRGGVKRIQATVYHDIRQALQHRLRLILEDCTAFVEYRAGKTVMVSDVIFALQRLGRPIYGFGERNNMYGK